MIRFGQKLECNCLQMTVTLELIWSQYIQNHVKVHSLFKVFIYNCLEQGQCIMASSFSCTIFIISFVLGYVRLAWSIMLQTQTSFKINAIIGEDWKQLMTFLPDKYDPSTSSFFTLAIFANDIKKTTDLMILLTMNVKKLLVLLWNRWWRGGGVSKCRI